MEQPVKKTTIKVSNITKARLDAIKIHHRETYEDIIIRLLEKEEEKVLQK